MNTMKQGKKKSKWEKFIDALGEQVAYRRFRFHQFWHAEEIRRQHDRLLALLDRAMEANPKYPPSFISR